MRKYIIIIKSSSKRFQEKSKSFGKGAHSKQDYEKQKVGKFAPRNVACSLSGIYSSLEGSMSSCSSVVVLVKVTTTHGYRVLTTSQARGKAI